MTARPGHAGAARMREAGSPPDRPPRPCSCEVPASSLPGSHRAGWVSRSDGETDALLREPASVIAAPCGSGDRREDARPTLRADLVMVPWRTRLPVTAGRRLPTPAQASVGASPGSTSVKAAPNRPPPARAAGRRRSRAPAPGPRRGPGPCRRDPRSARRAHSARRAARDLRRNPRASVRHGHRDAAAARSTPTCTAHRGATAVLHGVVEQRPEDLVDLVRVGHGEPAAGLVDQLEGDVARPQRLPRPPDARREREDLGHRAQDAGVEPADGQQLADHPREAVALLAR